MELVRSITVSIAISAVGLTSGCSGVIHKTSKIGHVSALSIDARQRIIISGTRSDGQDVVCAEPSPDAIVARASYLSAKASVAGKGNGQLGAGSAESAGSIGLRTQTIQLLRDGYYRVCEAYLNGAIGAIAYRSILRHIDTFMIALVAIESLGGVVAAPAIVVGTSGKLTLGGADVDATGEVASDKSIIQAIKTTTSTLSTEQSKAITEIVLAYISARQDPKF